MDFKKKKKAIKNKSITQNLNVMMVKKKKKKVITVFSGL